MNDVFGPLYAGAYDAVYAEKDYEAECDLVERLLATHGRRDGKTVLDLGCGTGGHALVLARRGYAVVGVDASPAMLARARAKAAAGARFVDGDVRTVDLGRVFDAVLMMFAVLGYQRSDGDVAAALATVRRHLRPGGLFIFDVWFGPAVIAQRPGSRSRTLTTAAGTIERTVSATLDEPNRLCTVAIEVRVSEGGRTAEHARENHVMRYFFPGEIESFLAQAGLALIRLGRFEDFEKAPDGASWNVLGVAAPCPSD